MNEPNDWNKWSQYVLKELERLNTCYKGLDEKANRINIEIARLKVKSGMWGAIGGAIPILVGLAIWLVKTQT